MDYYYWNNKVGIGTIFGISKESHLVKRLFTRENREHVIIGRKEKKLRKGEEEARAQEENSRLLKVKESIAGLTQVRGVYRRLMGIMG